MGTKRFTRAPNGYRVKQWADGLYHAYDCTSGVSEVSIGEFDTRTSAIMACYKHRWDAISKESKALIADIETRYKR